MAKKNLIFTLIGSSILIFILDYFNFLDFLKNPAELLVLPVKKTVFSIFVTTKNIGDIIHQYPQLANLIEKNQNLTQDNSELNHKITILEQQNTALSHQLGVPLPPQFQLIAAQVLALSRFMELSVGQTDGIKTGMVVVDGITLVGKVVDVSGHRSKVMIPTDSEISIPAKTNRGTTGNVTGQFGTNIILDKVLQKDSLFQGDQVVTSGLGDFPPNLIIGNVVSIYSPDVSVYKNAKVAAPIDYGTTQTVFVISTP